MLYADIQWKFRKRSSLTNQCLMQFVAVKMRFLINFKFVMAFNILIQLPAFIAYMKFTNLKCVAYDKPFADFRQCKLKALSRNTVALYLHVQLFQVPVNNVSVNLDVYKRANGYRPFMFNITMDFCQFLINKKRIPFFKLLMDTIAVYSNINHTCPFDVSTLTLKLSKNLFK